MGYFLAGQIVFFECEMGVLSFPFVFPPEVDEFIPSDPVEVSFWVFISAEPVLLDEPVALGKDFEDAFLFDIFLAHGGVLLECVDEFSFLLDELIDGVVDLFLPVIVEDFGVADIGVLVLVLYFVSHVLIIRFLPLFCSLFSISV